MTTLRAGSATDVGQVRSINQDSPMIVAPMDLYGVADGMGGHQGGEVASAMAVELTTEHATQPTLEALVEAVRVANRAIFEKAGTDRDLHGMGTTLVAVQLVHGPEGEEVGWVNVGDSRLYLLRDGRLVQLSQDHSLVEDMVRDGQITADEAAVHPQRNIVTRALGIDLEVVVDANTVLPFTGDRFLLCSDGLTNEVGTDEIVATLQSLDDPDAAATDLVRQANVGGGRDNITVVVVDVLDDGGRAAAASAALADDPTTVQSAVPLSGDGLGEEPETVPAPPAAAVPTEPTAEAVTTDLDAEPTTEPVAAPETVPGAADASESALSGARSSLPDAEDDYAAESDDLFGDLDKARWSHVTWRVVAFLLVLLVIGGIAVAAIGWSANRTYFVAYQDDQVALYQGKPGGVLWFDPKVIDTRDITREQTVEPFRTQIEAEKQFGSEADANAFLRNLREQVLEAEAEAEADAATTTTAPASTTTTTSPVSTTAAPPASAPGP